MTVFRNGRPLKDEDTRDITDLDRAEAMRAFHRKHKKVNAPGNLVSGGNLLQCSPRKTKNPHRMRVNGVSVK
jgi:hypothetical protein